MNKLYISVLSAMLCVQHIHSMEQQLALKTPPSNDDGYPIVYKPYEDRPVVKLSKEYNEYSEKLYAEGLNENDIEKLIKDGAVLNYTTQKKPGYHFSSWPIPLHFSFDGSEQGVKNMAILIKHGLALRNLEDDPRPVLSVPIQNNFTDMIQLLMPYENPVVTIYKSKCKDMDGYRTNTSEKSFRDDMINNCIHDQNIDSIKLLLKLGLMSANRGLKTFVLHMKPNQEILNLLRECGAEFTTDSVDQMVQKAFPFDQYIAFVDQVCDGGAFSKAALERMLRIQPHVDSIIENLTKNKYPSNK